jgi:hypothetical protein
MAITTRTTPAPKLITVGVSPPVTGRSAVVVPPVSWIEVLVSLLDVSEVGAGVGVGMGVDSGVGAGVGVGVGVGTGVGVGVGVGATHNVKSVVHLKPGLGQQYSLVPQNSILPALLQIESSEVPSASGGWQLRNTLSEPGHASIAGH